MCQPQLFPSCPWSSYIASNRFSAFSWNLILRTPGFSLYSLSISWSIYNSWLLSIIFFNSVLYCWLSIAGLPISEVKPLCWDFAIHNLSQSRDNGWELDYDVRLICVFVPDVMQTNLVILSQLFNLTKLSVSFISKMKIKIFLLS